MLSSRHARWWLLKEDVALDNVTLESSLGAIPHYHGESMTEQHESNCREGGES